MNEDEEIGLLPNGEQALTEDEGGDYDANDQESEDQEASDYEEASQGYSQEQTQGQGQEDDGPLSPATLASLGPVASETEINELAADLGFTPQQFAKASAFFMKVAQHSVAASGIGNAHLQTEVINTPGLQKYVPSIQRELAGVSPEMQTQKKVVQWAIATSFIKEAKDTDTFADIAKRIAKAAGLTVSSTPQRRNAAQWPQEPRTEPRRAAPNIPTPVVSGGTRNGTSQPKRGNTPSGALAGLASRYDLSAADLDVAKDEISGRRRIF